MGKRVQVVEGYIRATSLARVSSQAIDHQTVEQFQGGVNIPK
jgi:hypothetical protein